MTPTPTMTAAEGATLAPPAKTCPHCASDNVRQSSTRRGMDLLPANIGKDPYRCRACRARFYLRRDNEPTAPGAAAARRRRSDRKRDPFWKHPRIKRHMNEISIGLGSLFAFGLFLYLLARSGIAF